MSGTQPLIFPDHDCPDQNIVVEINNDQRDELFTLRGALDLVEKLRLISAEMSEITADYAALHQELLTERETRTNAQNKRDALVAAVLKCDDDKCTSGDWIALVLMARGMVGAK